KSKSEVWFATRSGAARLLEGKLKLFTENDGLESEIIHDIGKGLDGEVWVATQRGVGRWNGARWSFPKMVPFVLATNALGEDGTGHIFLGSNQGLYCVGDCSRDAIDAKKGFMDDSVRHLTVDVRGRVWALTKLGLSIVDP